MEPGLSGWPGSAGHAICGSIALSGGFGGSGGLMPPVRSASLDLARVLACVMGVAIHVSSLFVTERAGAALFAFAVGIDAFAHAAAPLFVMATGAALLSRHIDDWSAFYRRCFYRLVLPVGAWTLIYLSLRYLSLEPSAALPDLLLPLKDLAAGVPAFHMWLAYTLIGLYLAAPFLERAWRGCTERQRLGVTAAAMGYAMASALYAEVTQERVWWGLEWVHYVGFLLLGDLLCRSRWRLAPALSLYCLASGAAALLVAFTFLRWGSFYPMDHLSPTVVAASVGLFAALRARDFESPRWLRRASGVSLAFYLAHVLVLDIARVLIDLGSPFAQIAVLILATTAGAALIAFVAGMLEPRLIPNDLRRGAATGAP